MPFKKTEGQSRKSEEMDILSEYGNMDFMLGEGNTNSIERELDRINHGPEEQQDFQSLPNIESFFPGNEF